ncbi:MAG TPA: hypothetical protein DD727_08460 [Clostridiales bacterium]|nr:hypothetical protein [Clostridiales bacterium]
MTLRRLGEADRDILLHYLAGEPEYNLFVFGDIERFGLDSDQLDVWAIEPSRTNGSGVPYPYDSILLRFKDYYIPYSRSEDFSTGPVLDLLLQKQAKNVSGKGSVISRLKSGLEHIEFTDTFLSRLNRVVMDVDTDGIEKATLDNIEEITRLYSDIDEFDTRYQFQQSMQRSRDALNSGMGRFWFLRRDGHIAAVSASSAENSVSAMIVGVATSPQFRNQGLATRVVVAQCRELLREGKKFLCLFYYNPEAGRIYHRIGFEDIGTWTMGKPKIL